MYYGYDELDNIASLLGKERKNISGEWHKIRDNFKGLALPHIDDADVQVGSSSAQKICFGVRFCTGSSGFHVVKDGKAAGL